MKALTEIMKELPAERRDKINARSETLIAEEMTLRDLRKARDLTQVKMAEVLGVGQESISRLEGRADMLLSTLRGYIHALGGELDVVARFPDRPSVSLSSLFDQQGPEAGQSPESDKEQPPV